jgi:hypothetical protein
LDDLIDTEAVERVKTLFISDVHLGTRGCQAEHLLNLLKHYDAETEHLDGRLELIRWDEMASRTEQAGLPPANLSLQPSGIQQASASGRQKLESLLTRR